MPSLGVGYTEQFFSKRKICNVFSKPNSEPLPSHCQVRQVRRVYLRKYPGWAVNGRFYRQRSLRAPICAATNRPLCASSGHSVDLHSILIQMKQIFACRIDPPKVAGTRDGQFSPVASVDLSATGLDENSFQLIRSPPSPFSIRSMS
jgi:hypothetical protein